MIAAEGPARLPTAVHGEAERLAALVPSPGDPAHAYLASLSPKGRQTMVLSRKDQQARCAILGA